MWDGMKGETDREMSFYIGYDSRVKSCEEEDGCFVLNNSLILEQRDELSGDRK
jgi:hypothetical protein